MRNRKLTYPQILELAGLYHCEVGQSCVMPIPRTQRLSRERPSTRDMLAIMSMENALSARKGMRNESNTIHCHH
jgi:hypothetical protein